MDSKPNTSKVLENSMLVALIHFLRFRTISAFQKQIVQP